MDRERVGEFGVGIGEEVLLDGGGTFEAPHAVGYGFGEVALDLVFGIEALHVDVHVGDVGFAVVFGHEGDAAGETVAEGVEADAGFAFVGFGACGFFGVEAVGFDLLFGGHGILALLVSI